MDTKMYCVCCGSKFDKENNQCTACCSKEGKELKDMDKDDRALAIKSAKIDKSCFWKIIFLYVAFLFGFLLLGNLTINSPMWPIPIIAFCIPLCILPFISMPFFVKAVQSNDFEKIKTWGVIIKYGLWGSMFGAAGGYLCLYCF
ncbi:MAG: hypothetical protein K6G50_11025 [bacterium]|nr:hypothetical protein [bacterium]